MSILRQIGTRASQGFLYSHPPEAGITRFMQQDPGMTKRVSVSITFVGAGTNQLQAANGTFVNFTVNDVIVIEGTNKNNSIQTVTAIDGTNQSFLTVDQGLTAEGPLTATVRTL